MSTTQATPLVSTPFGIGAAAAAGGAFTHVQFPWGHAYMHSEQVAAAPDFTFYALVKAQHVKFTLPFSLTSLGEDMVAAVRRRLEVPDELAITLVQTNSVGRHEIKPDKKIGDCTVGTGPLHPVLVLQTPVMRFDRSQCALGVRLEERDTVALQTAPGFGSVLGGCEISRGVKYWEVKLTASCGGDGVFVGVAAVEDQAIGSNSLSRGLFWGFSCATGHKVHDSIDAYANPCKDGDVVGALLDLDYGRLSFYVNGRYIGVAFTGVNVARLRPAFALTSVGQQIALLPTASPPLN